MSQPEMSDAPRFITYWHHFSSAVCTEARWQWIEPTRITEDAL